MSLMLLPCFTASATASTCRATSATGMLSSRITRQMGAKNSYLHSTHSTMQQQFDALFPSNSSTTMQHA
jgi:hypothetical protein